MLMRFAVGASVGVFLLAATGAACACEGSVVLLEDHFSTNASIWESSSSTTLADGKLELKTKAGKADKVIGSPLYKDVDLCADMAVVAGSNLSTVYVGLGFWMTDYQNLYTFQITPEGFAGVYRLNKDKWETTLEDKASDSIKKGRDAVNTLRVVTDGNNATLYINGDQFGEITGEPPEEGQHVGFVVEASSQSSSTFQFDDMNVTVPE
jgi:hypothetical protein